MARIRLVHPFLLVVYGFLAAWSHGAAPNAVDDLVHTPQIVGGWFAVDVLANDSGDGLELVSVGETSKGLANIFANKIEYWPNESFDGNDTLTYQVRDSSGGIVSAQLTLFNSPVTAADDFTNLTEAGAEADVLVRPQMNDTDGDGDPLTVVSVTQPRFGTVTLYGGTDLIYVRQSLSFEPDRFTYTVSDGRGSTATANVEVRPFLFVYRPRLSVGDVLHPSRGDMVVKGFGASGFLGGNFVLLKTEVGGKPEQSLVGRRAVMLWTAGGIPEMPGAVIDTIEEPAGCAVSVKYEENETGKLRRAVVFLNEDTGLRLVMHERQVLPDGSLVLAIDRFSGVKGRVFILAKLRLATGGTAQSLQMWQEGELEELLRTNASLVDGERVRSITTMLPAPRSPADNRWIDDSGRIATSLAFHRKRDKAIVVLQAGQAAQVVARLGAPDLFDGRYARFGLPAVCPEGAAFVTQGRYRNPSFRMWHFCATLPGQGLTILASQFGEGPSPRYGQFLSFSDPVAGMAGDYVLFARMKRQKPHKEEVLCWYRNGESKTVAVADWPDDEYQYNPDPILRFESIVHRRAPGSGPAFTAMMRDGLSLWTTDNLGFREMILRPGKKLSVLGQHREVESFRALEGATGPGIAARGFEDAGYLEAIVKFTDGTESLMEFFTR